MNYYKWLAITCLTLVALVTFCHWQNNGLVVTELEFCNERVPRGFQGFRIAQVSDLHNKEIGRGNDRLLAKIKDAQPDIIVITGDLIDSRRTKIDVAVSFVVRAGEIAPVYYVSGNHEYNVGQYSQFKEQLLTAGAIVLDNSGIILERQDQQIVLFGLADPAFIEYEYEHLADNSNGMFAQNLADLRAEYQGMFSILLSHRPECMSWSSPAMPTAASSACPLSGGWWPRARDSSPSTPVGCMRRTRPAWWLAGAWETVSSPYASSTGQS